LVAVRALDGDKNGFFYPLKYITDHDCPEDVGKEVLEEIHKGLSKKTTPLDMDFVIQSRAKLNVHGLKLDHFLFKVYLNPRPGCCRGIKSVTWIPSSHLSPDIWGFEPSQFSIEDQNKDKERKLIQEVVPSFSNRIDPKRLEEAGVVANLLKSAKYDLQKLKLLYQEYYAQAWPSMYWSLATFRDYLEKIGWTSPMQMFDYNLFKGFTSRGSDVMTYSEFVIGMAATEKRVPHGGNCGYFRALLLLRFYDGNRDDLLSEDDVGRMQHEIVVLTATEDQSKQHLYTGPFPLDKARFIEALNSKVRGRSIKGSSVLARRPFDIFAKRVFRMENVQGSISYCARHEPSQEEFGKNELIMSSTTGSLSVVRTQTS